jgi:hypothetical protein
LLGWAHVFLVYENLYSSSFNFTAIIVYPDNQVGVFPQVGGDVFGYSGIPALVYPVIVLFVQMPCLLLGRGSCVWTPVMGSREYHSVVIEFLGTVLHPGLSLFLPI